MSLSRIPAICRQGTAVSSARVSPGDPLYGLADYLNVANDRVLGLAVRKERLTASDRVALNRIDRRDRVEQVGCARPSQEDGIGIDTLTQKRAHAAIAEHIDMGAEQILEILPQTNEVDQAAPRSHLDQEVHVAPRVGLPTRDPGVRDPAWCRSS
jgi:hypothetical protein